MGDDQQERPGEDQPSPTQQAARTSVDGPPPYVARPPERRKWGLRTAWDTAGRLGRRARHLFLHSVSTYHDGPTHPHQISTSSPEGVFNSDWLPAAQEVERKSEVRHEKLEQKSTVMLSVVAVLAPIIASATVYITKDPSLPVFVARLAIIFGIGAMAAILLAFVAALRTLGVREHQEILIGGLVDDQRVRAYSADFRIRGILWTAANREAINDHIADFVRASQMFLGFGVALILLTGATVLPFLDEAEPQTTGLDSASVEVAGATRARGAAPLVWRSDHIEERLDSLPTATELEELKVEMEVLRVEIAELRGGGENR